MTDVKALAARISRALHQVADAYPDTLEPVRRLIESYAVSCVTEPPLPLPAATLDARRAACDVLENATRLVIAGRHLHRLASASVPALCTFLLIHVDYLGEHHSEVVRGLERSADDLAQIVAQNAPRRFTVGACPVVDCFGVLRVTLHRDDDLLPSIIKCTLDAEHKWVPSQWKYMARVG